MTCHITRVLWLCHSGSVPMWTLMARCYSASAQHRPLPSASPSASPSPPLPSPGRRGFRRTFGFLRTASWELRNGNFDVDVLSSSYTYMTPSGWRCNQASWGCVLVAAGDTAWGGGGSASGANYLGLQNSASASTTVSTAVTQTFAIPATQQLRITFSARYRPGYNSAGSLSIWLGSQHWSQSSLAASWTSYSYSYNGSLPLSESANLTIQNTCPLGGDCTAEIDDVRVSGASYVAPSFLYARDQR
jgi:hypothetical protein